MKMWILKLFDPLYYLIEGSRLLYIVSKKLNVRVKNFHLICRFNLKCSWALRPLGFQMTLLEFIDYMVQSIHFIFLGVKKTDEFLI